MELKNFEKEECLKQAVEITKAYARSGENKHGPVADFLEIVYRRLLSIRQEMAAGNENE